MSISSRGALTGWARNSGTGMTTTTTSGGGGGGVSGTTGTTATGTVRRSHSTTGAQWNIHVVKSKVNGKCLWNACKALSLGLLLMVLGATMATIGYYADQLSLDQVTRGNHTVIVKNESRGFHLNNLSYAGPIVMGVGGFIIVAACVMTFEARDSAAKVVPARLKMYATTTAPPSNNLDYLHEVSVRRSGHGSIRATGLPPSGSTANYHGHGNTGDYHRHHHQHIHHDRHNLTQSFVQFSRGLALESKSFRNVKYTQSASPSGTRSNSLKVPQQGSINRSPSAPDLGTDQPENSPLPIIKADIMQLSPTVPTTMQPKLIKPISDHQSSRRTFTTGALLNPGLLYRHALSVDEASANYRSNDSLHHGTSGSQGSMAMDLHYESVTLKIRDKRRNPLKRQRKFEEEEHSNNNNNNNNSRRNSHSSHSHSCSPRLTNHHYMKDNSNNNAHQYYETKRRSSNTSDCTHRSRNKKRNSICHSSSSGRGKLERAISSDSRLTRTSHPPQCYHSYEPSRNNSAEQDNPVTSTSDSDIRKSHQVMVHFSSAKHDE